MRSALPIGLTLCLLLSLFTPIETVFADDKAAIEAAKKTLEDKGLKTRGSSWLLDSEIDLAQDMRELRKAKLAVDKVERDQRSIDRKIRQAKAFIAQKQYEFDKLRDKLTKAQSAIQQNQLIAEMQKAKQFIEEAIKVKQENENKMEAARREAREVYVEQVLIMSNKVGKVAAEYDALEKDAAVTGAVKSLNDAGLKYSLGPGSLFKANQTLVARYKDEILSGDIKLRPEGNVFWVEVIINGKSRREMVLDSGASLLSIPADMAKELGLMPSADDPIVRLALADGKIVDAKLMVLDSVQVGEFVVNNVECAVLPESLIAAQPLLGGTYLNKFTYKIQSDKGTLTLVRLKGANDNASDEKKKD